MKGPGRLGRALHEEHFWTLVIMASLEDRVTGDQARVPFDAGVAADRERLEEILTALANMTRHNAFEEGVLFPTLWDRGAADMTRVFTEDHSEIGPLSNRLRGLTLDLLGGEPDPTVWGRFRATSMHLSAQVMIHLQKEELALVRHLGSILGERLDAELMEQFMDEKSSGSLSVPGSVAHLGASRPSGSGGSVDHGAVHSYRKDTEH